MTLPGLLLLAALVRIIPIDGHPVTLVTDPADVAQCERVGRISTNWEPSAAKAEEKLAKEATREGGDTVLVGDRLMKVSSWVRRDGTRRSRVMAWGIAYRCN